MKLYTLKLPVPQIEKLKKLSEWKDLSVSELIRRAIDGLLDKQPMQEEEREAE